MSRYCLFCDCHMDKEMKDNAVFCCTDHKNRFWADFLKFERKVNRALKLIRDIERMHADKVIAKCDFDSAIRSIRGLLPKE